MKSSTKALTTGFLVLLLGVSFAKADVCMMLYQMAGKQKTTAGGIGIQATPYLPPHVPCMYLMCLLMCLLVSFLCSFLLSSSCHADKTDNDLEYFIVNDLLELVQSPAIADPTLTTWVYHDGRNYDAADVALGYYVDDGSPVIADALPLIYDTDGNPLSSKITTSSYMTYNHDLDKMVVVATSQEELNGDDQQTVVDFVYTALLDCIERGSNEYMLFFSSHGSGYVVVWFVWRCLVCFFLFFAFSPFSNLFFHALLLSFDTTIRALFGFGVSLIFCMDFCIPCVVLFPLLHNHLLFYFVPRRVT